MKNTTPRTSTDVQTERTRLAAKMDDILKAGQVAAAQRDSLIAERAEAVFQSTVNDDTSATARIPELDKAIAAASRAEADAADVSDRLLTKLDELERETDALAHQEALDAIAEKAKAAMAIGAELDALFAQTLAPKLRAYAVALGMIGSGGRSDAVKIVESIVGHLLGDTPDIFIGHTGLRGCLADPHSRFLFTMWPTYSSVRVVKALAPEPEVNPVIRDAFDHYAEIGEKVRG
jgi:hypothetical protein